MNNGFKIAANASVGVGGLNGTGGGVGGAGSRPVPSGVQPFSSPIGGRIRAYFAPVNRVESMPTYFDPSQAAGFDADQPPTPWLDLGWVENFARKSQSKFQPMRAGAPSVVEGQVRQDLQAIVSLRFLSWGKLQMALAAGSEQMNLLAAPAGNAAPSGAAAAPAVYTAAGSTSTTLQMAANSAGNFQPGQMVAVDNDYARQTGYVGTGASAAYVSSSVVPAGADYIRRMTLNVATIAAVEGNPATSLTLASPLLGGAPPAGMGVQAVVGFVDREGGNFFQEWSALFAVQGAQGDWIFYHYPRLQTMQGAAETAVELAGPLQWIHLDAQFVALPVTDPNDGAQVLCFRSYLPAPSAAL